jgi:hypothetical protein
MDWVTEGGTVNGSGHIDFEPSQSDAISLLRLTYPRMLFQS